MRRINVHNPWETFVRVVQVFVSHARRALRCDRPSTPIPPVRATVQRNGAGLWDVVDIWAVGLILLRNRNGEGAWASLSKVLGLSVARRHMPFLMRFAYLFIFMPRQKRNRYAEQRTRSAYRPTIALNTGWSGSDSRRDGSSYPSTTSRALPALSWTSSCVSVAPREAKLAEMDPSGALIVVTSKG